MSVLEQRNARDELRERTAGDVGSADPGKFPPKFPPSNQCHFRGIVSTVASKILTREQAQSRKDAAVRFAENVLDDPDKADDISSEDLDSWIERKGIHTR